MSADEKAAELGSREANDEIFSRRQALALVSAHKIAVALPVLPHDLKPPAIREILSLLNAGLECKEAA